ncbi:DEAD/DEAH box helicase [Paenibacillus brevis]|uniref:DEAD/DEAH box helicase n=1 Tax=Paenibacillus brevis TaxID=2841508 RepID=A0ABS6FLI2_9BACL|nr:DEAD/DEAH box helicase [Paenibacillus brevis]MBU5671065.1 DEAD/DEAH box helicase [Paenibacillus brevis]
MNETYGAFKISNVLHETLRSYLESAYHIKNNSLIRERVQLLNQLGQISQEPYIEATPSYKMGASYDTLDIPDSAKQILMDVAKLSNPGVGVFPKPYTHQAKALESFLGDDKDIIVATGTGSGKTESFLMPILASLAIEAKERTNVASMRGCRAILLYPMNALVNDQLGRIRRLFGDERVASFLQKGRSRNIQFGSYTSKTPYPGVPKSGKTTAHIEKMFENFYLKYAEDAEKVKELQSKGKWPSKDLVQFYAKNKEQIDTFKTGKKQGKRRVTKNWNLRLKTQPNDRELLTRHEMQELCPDILITNYSMLEYMLMRPIERKIFEDTKKWLEADPSNKLILVLDEAHMYRGTGGAEVAFLIRRLMARLGIDRSRMKCILTSASLGKSEEDERAIIDFAGELTGITSNYPRKFQLITGDLESRAGWSKGTTGQADILSNVDLFSIQNALTNPQTAINEFNSTASKLKWNTFKGNNFSGFMNHLFFQLTGWGPAEQMINVLSGNALPLGELTKKIFPDSDEQTAQKAVEVLLALGALARREIDNKVLLPTRLHLFFRGIPGLYACTNQQCECRLDKTDSNPILGRLHAVPMLNCTCQKKARVYELLTHRDCGAAFIVGYTHGEHGDFLLHEPTNITGVNDEVEDRLYKIQLLVDGEPNERAVEHSVPAWLDISSGKLFDKEPTELEGFIKVFKPIGSTTEGRVFNSCPICLKKWKKNKSKIMNLSTKGEAPFANLVKAQLFNQPAQRIESNEYPNGGRKVLLFSDGRQKAARLARDIPREVEWDTFRQAIVLAAVRYKAVCNRDPKINDALYVAFVSIVSEFNLQFFDGDDRKSLLLDVREFKDGYSGSLKEAIEEQWDVRPSSSYHKAILRQLCNREYSLRAATVGYLKPTKSALKRIQNEISIVTSKMDALQIEALINYFIEEILDDYAFELETKISSSVRRKAAGYSQNSWTSSGKIGENQKFILENYFNISLDEITSIQEILRKRLCHKVGDAFVINSNEVVLNIDIESEWYKCDSCTFLSPVKIGDYCVNCGSKEISSLDPENHEYIKARKGFLRNPVVMSVIGKDRPKYVTAEEHTAQLSHKDAGEIFASNEMYELRFQDVKLEQDELEGDSIDVLSCTTTMEVGIDIGSLVAVGLRNVPPQRENYQQRAGRAGRRGSSLSTVITYAEGAPHDSFYFQNPDKIVSGAPRLPMIKINNIKIAKRHVFAFLFQTFFHEMIDKDELHIDRDKNLFAALGSVTDFFNEESDSNFRKVRFIEWIEKEKSILVKRIIEWLPERISDDKDESVNIFISELLHKLNEINFKKSPSNDTNSDEDDEDEIDLSSSRDELLTYLFNEGFLPSYAFPTSLCSFPIELRKEKGKNSYKIFTKELPQQSIDKALSEYAPGRLVVIDKKTYRSGGIVSNDAKVTDPDRAEKLFQHNLRKYVSCRRCTFVRDINESIKLNKDDFCPVCEGPLDIGELLIPEVFLPEKGTSIIEGDDEQELTYATTAQFPLPLSEDDLGEWKGLGKRLLTVQAKDRWLVTINKGNDESNAGFYVCEACGASKVVDPEDKTPNGSHERPYQVEPLYGVNVTTRCHGSFKNVFLGHDFKSDLLLIRLNIEEPFVRTVSKNLANHILNAALRTVSEAVLLAASRELDIDPSEFKSGYRLVKLNPDETLRADIYMFDSLAGGAGYAEQTGKDLPKVLNKALTLLENCPQGCDRSCTDCIRHYQNRYWHTQLDRHLGSQLLRYMIHSKIPDISDVANQSKALQPLVRLLQLEGYTCEDNVSYNGIQVPWIISNKNSFFVIGAYPSLIDETDSNRLHPLTKHFSKEQLFLVNEYLIGRNLSLVYKQFKEKVMKA